MEISSELNEDKPDEEVKPNEEDKPKVKPNDTKSTQSHCGGIITPYMSQILEEERQREERKRKLESDDGKASSNKRKRD